MPQPVVTKWGNWLNAALCSAKNLLKVKAIVESLEESNILVTLAKATSQTTSLVTQLLKIKDQYECLVMLLETIESAKYTIKEAVQAIQVVNLGEDTRSTNLCIRKRMQNNNITEMNIGRDQIFYRLFTSTFSTSNCLRKKFYHDAKTVRRAQKLKRRDSKTVHDYIFQFLHLVIAELAACIRRAHLKLCWEFVCFCELNVHFNIKTKGRLIY